MRAASLNVGPLCFNWGMIESDLRSRHDWLPSALSVLFGDEPIVSAPVPQIPDLVEIFAGRASAIRDQVLLDAASLDGIDPELIGVGTGSWAEVVGDFDAPMRVVLMGRTMAGKSSILSALSGSHFDRIGDGRQRFSCDPFAATSTVDSRIEVVDTPGVGARDGAEDFEMAFNAARNADLILWVASSDSIQEETARALRLLGVIGKPIIVVLNCRQSLEGIGRLNLTRFPERVFGHREGLVDEIRRHMATVGVEPLEVVYVHALAAAEALTRIGELDDDLRESSRIDDLTDALNREYATHSESRRALRVVDGQRHQADRLMLSLAQGSRTYHAQAKHNTKLTKDIQSRLSRVVHSASEGMVSDIAIIIGRRRDWHVRVTDFGKTLQHAWETEIEALQAELDKTLDTKFTQLKVDVESTIAAADAEWTLIPLDQFDLRGLTDFDSVLGNRLARAGAAGISISGAMAGAWAGAKVGALIGLSGGPLAIVTTVVGGLIGAGVGAAVKPLKRVIDGWILGKDGVLRKRQDEVSKQVGPLLDGLKEEYERVILEQLDRIRDGLSNARSQGEDQTAGLTWLANRLTEHSNSLHSLIRELDKDTTSALLRISGRERLARSLKRATRVPGVCILAEFENLAFSEAWLYPPNIGEKLAGGRSRSRNGAAAGALSYALGLVDAPARLSRSNSASATISVDADLPEDIMETWSDALTTHIGRHIRIESTRKTLTP